MMMFSRTVSSMSSVSSCGTTPRRARIFTPSRAGSRPRMCSVPSVTGETQPIMRMVEVFPAPFGPRKPNASPRSKSIPSTATNSPNRLTRLRAWIRGCALTAVTRDTLPMAIGSTATAKAAAFWDLRATGISCERVPSCALFRPLCPLRRLHVAADLLYERLLAVEHCLVSEPLPQLDDEALPVQVALEVEQVRLDSSFRSAVVRVRPD